MDPGTILILLIPAALLLAGLAVACGTGPAARCHWPVVVGCGLSSAAAVGLLALALLRSDLGAGPVYTLELYRWIGSDDSSLALDVSLRLDLLSLAAIAVVSLAMTALAAGAAVLDSVESGRRRAFAELACLQFVTVMLLASGQLWQFYVFWQLLSVAIWILVRADAATKVGAQSAGRVLLTHLSGDALLLGAVLVCGTQLGTLSLSGLAQHTDEFLGAGVPEAIFAQRAALIGLAGFLVAGAALIRAGQFPAFGWLSAAGRGGADAWDDAGRASGTLPVVDAPGIRAATRSALMQLIIMPLGLYLIVRLQPLLAAAPDARWMLVVLGSLTAAAAGFIALCEDETEQVLLFTTASQLGLAVAGAASGVPAGMAGGLLLWFVLVTARTALVLTMRAPACKAGSDAVLAPAVGWSTIVLVVSGLAGQHAVLTALWGEAEYSGPAGFLLAGLAALSMPLTAGALVRLWLNASCLTSPAFPNLSVIPLFLTTFAAGLIVVSLAVPETFARLDFPQSGDRGAAPLEGSMILITLLLALIGAAAGWLFWLRRRPQPAGQVPIDDTRPFVRLARRRFYVDEVFFLLVVFPVRAAAQLSRFLEWLVVDSLTSGVPRRFPGWVGRRARPVDSGAGQFVALALVLATAVLLIVLIRE